MTLEQTSLGQAHHPRPCFEKIWILGQTYTPTPQSSLCPNGQDLTEAKLGGSSTSCYSHTFEHPLSPEGNIGGTWTAHNEKRQVLIRGLCFKSELYSHVLLFAFVWQDIPLG